MGTQRLSAKACRRIERVIGEPVEFGTASGGYVMGFVTPDHRHGWWNKATGEWGWYDTDPGTRGMGHYANGCAPWRGEVDTAAEEGSYRRSYVTTTVAT